VGGLSPLPSEGLALTGSWLWVVPSPVAGGPWLRRAGSEGDRSGLPRSTVAGGTGAPGGPPRRPAPHPGSPEEPFPGLRSPRRPADNFARMISVQLRAF
jgi:hypothetical protein